MLLLSYFFPYNKYTPSSLSNHLLRTEAKKTHSEEKELENSWTDFFVCCSSCFYYEEYIEEKRAGFWKVRSDREKEYGIQLLMKSREQVNAKSFIAVVIV